MTNPTLELLISTGNGFNESFVVTDLHREDYPLIYVNEAFCQLTGYSKAEIEGRNCRFLQGADTTANIVTAIRTGVAKRKCGFYDVLNYRKNGEKFWNRLLLFPAGEDLEDPDYFVGVQHEVPQDLIRNYDENDGEELTKENVQNPFFKLMNSEQAKGLYSIQGDADSLKLANQLSKDMIAMVDEISKFLRTH